MGTKSISIIIPMYNVEDYIADCLHSILKQIQNVDEIIIIDDGSTDNSYNICENIIINNKNVVLKQQKNKGPGAARNYGIDIAKGDYILFLDSDDMLKENTIFSIRKIIENNQVDMLLFGADILAECDFKYSENQYGRDNVMLNKVISGKDMFVELYPKKYMQSACLSLDRRGFLLDEQLRFPEGIFHEDDVFTFKAIMQAKKVLCVKEKYYIRRYRENSIMVSGWSYKRWFGALNGSVNIWEYLKKNWDIISKQKELVNVIMSYSLSMLKRVVEKSQLDFFEMSGYSIEYVINEFLRIWNLYYKSNIDSFIKYKGSLYLYCLFEKNKTINIKGQMDLIISDYNVIMERYQYHIRKKLSLLPLDNAELKVGIYGVGKHTKELFKQYNNLIGNIRCNYFFVDSYTKDDKEMYLGRPILNIKNVKNIVDIIVVSSFVYMEDINNKIDEILGCDFPRICLYDENEICSSFG